MPDKPLYEIPFVVGVTGHRDLLPAQVPAIRAAVESLLKRLIEAHPDVRIQMLCSMADGADLLVGEVALSQGLDVLALLTFPEDVCRADLMSEEARASFDRVIARAERLELPLPAGTTRESLTPGSPARDLQYQRAGLLLARYCSLLIAIWDGKPTRHVAGSARTIEFRRRGLRLSQGHDPEPTDVLLSASDNDLVFEIRVDRSSNAAAAALNDPAIEVTGFTGAEIQALGSAGAHELPRSLNSLLARTGDFNRDSRKSREEIARKGWPLSPKGADSPATLAMLDQLFVQADFLGSAFRRRFLRAILFRYTLWAVMATLLFTFERVSEGVAGLAIILAVLAIFVASRAHASRAHRYSWHRKYLDYRALAEALRVDYYWEVTGVRRRYAGEFAHESFLQKQDADLEWIRAAMRSVSMRVAMQSNPSSTQGFAQALSEWIGDDSAAGKSGQIHYYGMRAGQLHHRLHRAEAIDKVLLGLGLALAATFLVDIVISLTGYRMLPHDPRHYLLWAMALLTVYAGILETYVSERADRALIRQYRYMHSLFGYAARELRTAPTEEHELEVLRSLGHACLAEHAQWTLAQRDKTIQGLKW
jgi:hypothetical protein